MSGTTLPIVFEPTGAIGSDAPAMLGQVSGVAVGFRAAGFVIRFPETQDPEMRVDFVGARGSTPIGEALLDSHTNYLVGNDPSHWRTHVSNYKRVRYTGLYPGVDAVFYGTGAEIEHDFVVAPGADYKQIRLHFSRGTRLSLDNKGDLILALGERSIAMQRPVMYQELNGQRQFKQGAFKLLGGLDVGFKVSGYDPRRPLIVDPVLSFATYLSTSAGVVNYIATDAAGNNFITGYASLGFPVTQGAFAGCATCSANAAVTFVSKLSPDGSNLVYSTVLGGNNFAQPTGLAVDAKGNAVVSGWTGASDFPTKNGQAILPQNNNYVGVLFSLSPDGSSLNYSTLLGPGPTATQNSMTYAMAVALDPAGNAFVTGETGNGFPTTPGALNQGGGGIFGTQFNVFLAKFGVSGNLLYSAMIGDADPQNGGGGPIGAYALGVDSVGNAYVAGQAGTLWPISSNAYLKQIAGSNPYATPFVTKVAADAKSLIYSTYLDYAYVVTGVTPLSDGNVFVTGNYAEPNYPTTPGAYQQSSAAGGNAFLTELNATGSALVYSTVFGDATYQINGMALDSIDGSIWLAGRTSDSQFPLLTPLQDILPQYFGLPGPASTLTEFDPTGKTLKFSTLLGGQAAGYASSIAIDTQHRAHLGGAAGFGMFTTPGVYDPQVPVPGQGFSGATYGYVALVDTTVPAPALCVSPNTPVSFGLVTVGTSVDFKITIKSCGTLPLAVAGATTDGSVFTVPASANGCTQSLPVGKTCNLSVRYSPTGENADSATLTIESNASIPRAFLPISGNGAIPHILVSGFPQFDYTLVGQTSAPQSVVIQTGGTAPLKLDASKTSISGDFSFQGLAACPSPLLGSCTLSLYFKPTAAGSRSGSLIIASNDSTNPTVTVNLFATGYATAPVPQITSATSQLVPAGVGEPNFLIDGYGFLPSSIVKLNGIAQTTIYRNSAELSVDLTATSIPASSYGELSLTVETPGGGASAPFTLTKFQSLTDPAAAMIYEAVSKKLYLSIPAADATHPNTILVVDPVTATQVARISVGSDPAVLAASTDGKYLYVGLNGDHTIQRINLSTNAVERTFSLPVDVTFGKTTVFDMHVVPTSSQEVVASLQLSGVSPPEAGIAFFNDTGMVNWIAAQPQGTPNSTISTDRFTFTTDATTLYARTGFNASLAELNYSTGGLQYSSNTCCTPPSLGAGNGSMIASDGSLIYTTTGLVWDPSAGGKIVRTYSVEPATVLDSVIPDPGSGKTYFLNPYDQYFYYGANTVQAFNQTSAALTGSLSLTTGVSPQSVTGTQLARWGTNGFAFRAYTIGASQAGSVILFTSGIATGSNLNPVPTATTLQPSSTPASGTDFTLTVNGTGFITGSTIEWNGSPRITKIVSSTQVSATVYASDIATAGNASVTVVSPGPGGGTTGTLTFTIGSAVTAPAVTLTPPSVSFGSQIVGITSSTQIVTITNSGSANLSGIVIGLGGANASSFTQTNNCGATLTPNASCTASASFTPISAGTAAGSLIVSDNASGSPQNVALTGAGVAPSAPTVVLSPNSLTFSSQEIGTTSATQSITLSNTGSANLTGISISLAGSDAGSFAEISLCGVTLAVNTSCAINVTFKPKAAGAASASVNVADDAVGSPQSVALTGLAPQTPIAIGPQAGGSTSSTVVSGLTANYVLSLTPVAGYSGTLTFSCSNLPANASCSFIPASLALASGASASFTVSIATQTTQTAALVRNVALGPLFAITAFFFPWMKKIARKRFALCVLVLSAMIASISACGGSSGGGSTGGPSPAKVAPGTYAVQLVASDGTVKQTQPLTLIVQ